ncbi:Pr5-like receptor kinase [Thalictrum thalictroides]|uniref:non-specific serine/threonine protein kinase n=1 Tax=Thalictrum thalictroides TaxID=46969 RepID=A0A7J6WNS1_THATH|nr:Pr5-like receptor kinase [Thalictrum thalictroides]
MASRGKVFTLAEVSKHNTSKDCWLVINNKVYDVTKFLEDHPGGDEVLLSATGKDATDDFKDIGHSNSAMEMMDEYYVGDFVTNASSAPMVSGGKVFTLAEVSKHNSLKDCWLVINEKVYDVTEFLEDHPGGDEVLLSATGKDATDDFKDIGHSNSAMAMMDEYYVGDFVTNASLEAVVDGLTGRDVAVEEFVPNSSSDSISRLFSELAREKPRPYSHAELMKFTENFSIKIGSGGFGDVYKGQFPDGVAVAVKVLKNSHPDVMEKQFVAEVSTMGRTYHRNLIKLYGFCYEDNIKALVYEYMENGSLDKVLFKNHFDLQWGKLYNIAIEIARGISYLHDSCHPQIIHHDIKPGNVLLDSKFSPKVIDFGIARLNRDLSQFTQTGIRGTYGYVAPEICLGMQAVSYKCDVYSFGMMLFDILGSKRKGAGQGWLPGEVRDKFQQKQLDTIIMDCGIVEEEDKVDAKTLSIVALLCAEHNPRNRPSMSTVVKMLEGEIPLWTPVDPFPYYDSSSESSTIGSSTRTRHRGHS